GSGSRWTSSQSLFVGGNSTTSNGTGILNVNSFGMVNVGDKLKLWNRGTVNLNGGTINAASLELVPSSSSPFPTFNFNSGTFRFTGNATLDSSLLDTLLGPAHAVAPGKHL